MDIVKDRSSMVRTLVKIFQDKRLWRSSLLPAREAIAWQLYRRTKRFNEKQKQDLRSVCLILGPYRNLTTLTGAVVSLHPFSQVLNHSGERVLSNPQLNFLVNYSERIFEQFCQFAIFASQRGQGGPYGGSITFSHAFSQNVVKDIYQKRYGNRLIKEEVHCILWKESLRLSNFILQHKIDLDALFAQNHKIKFLLPVRNPLDCTYSNCKGSRMLLFKDLGKDSPVEEVLDSILQEFVWFLGLKTCHPERFLFFFQDELNEQFLVKLASFLEIEPERQWIEDSKRCMQLKKTPYHYTPELIETYKRSLKEYFTDYPEFLDGLKRFIPTYSYAA